MHEFRQLEPEEQAALLYAVVFDIQDKNILFKIANGEKRFDKLLDSSKKITIPKWFRSDKIQMALADLRYILEAKKNEANEEYYKSRAETETKKNETGRNEKTPVNFLNLDEFLQYANEQANKISDEKERRAWVEMIGKYMNFKENDEETEQIRAYLPLSCEGCALYKAAKEGKTL
jgi:hypothetical protein